MADEAADSAIIKTFKLKGHQGPVTCLDHSSSLILGGDSRRRSSCTPTSAGCLLSGSEDGTCRLWDLREKLRASLCIKTSGTVLSVAFYGPQLTAAEDTLSAGVYHQQRTSSLFAQDISIYLSTGNSVYGYDLRKANSPIIVEPEFGSIHVALDSADEVNQISISPPRTASEAHFLAAADDAGAIRVTDEFTGYSHNATSSSSKRGGPPPRRRILLHSRTPGQACMVTSAVFRTYSKSPLLASGGTDCSIQLWDVTKPRKPLSTQTIGSLDTGAHQVCNPPMVNSLSWSPSGRLLAAALGDGSVSVFAMKNDRHLLLMSRMVDAHSGAAACAVFPEWSPGIHDLGSPTHDRLLATAGNDGAVVLWDLGAENGGNMAMDPTSFLSISEEDEIDKAAAALSNMQLEEDGPKTLFAWSHGAKPNWVVSSRGRDSVFPSTLFVADTTNEITAYTVPLQ